MILQKQPNRASCLATAFAIVMGIDVGFIFKALGHDGTEVAFTNLSVPQCYRGFHSAELIWLANLYDWQILELPKNLAISHDMRDITTFIPTYNIRSYLSSHDAVMTDGGHAVAWDGQRVYDPCGKVYDDWTIDRLYFEYEIFYIFKRL